MLRKLWKKYIIEPARLRGCADYGFVADTTMDQLCKRFDGTLAKMYFAIMENDRAAIETLIVEQKAIQTEGGDKLKKYLTPYFVIASQLKDGGWGNERVRTIPGGWERFRTAKNWHH